MALQTDTTENNNPGSGSGLHQSIKLLLLSFSGRGIARGPPGPPGPPGPSGPSVAGGSGFTSVTLDYSELTKGKFPLTDTDYSLHTFSKNSGNLVTHSPSSSYLHLLRSSIPGVD